eukprot:Plantae.Rhodophyta-Hildenbrandia_rubra.ctg1476.p1 GENE.Plantae.Rhodophyta-Hildenbrandia_rubra.ctg1476~~Plantae.Rhodophyta-Hildenbrandia_rubra.ctg1476.p1  ORF type:complete len:485 (-),score=36.03 Plantae.Rhodophyta-Hildenbrandia_rubra.ctg1476:19-1473(-)
MDAYQCRVQTNIVVLIILIITTCIHQQTCAEVITVPIQAVPPRPQHAKSPQGMPYRLRLIDVSQSNPSTYLRRLLGVKPIIRRYDVELLGGIIGVGEYYANVKIGGKNVRVQIDTGSSTLAVPMRGCTSCHRHGRYYKLGGTDGSGYPVSCAHESCRSNSCGYGCRVCSLEGACCSSKRPFDCGFGLKYADGSSASGSLVHDQLEWGGLITNITFGGILENSPSFERDDVDGILGMAFKSLACNPSCVDPPFDALVNTGRINNIFSICMTSNHGKLTLGGIDNTTIHHSSTVNYAPLMLSNPPKYYRLSLNGHIHLTTKHTSLQNQQPTHHKVSLPNFRRAIVDTGATLIVVSSRAFKSLKQEFQRHYCEVPELCGSSSWFQNGMCVSLSMSDLKKLPTISFTVGDDDQNVQLEFEPWEYMIEYKRDGRSFRCIGIMGLDGIGGMVILGNTVMQKYVVVYDRQNYRVGFTRAAASCGQSVPPDV